MRLVLAILLLATWLAAPITLTINVGTTYFGCCGPRHPTKFKFARLKFTTLKSPYEAEGQRGR